MTEKPIFSGGLFRTVLADPPWPYRSSKAIVGNAGRGDNLLTSGGTATQVAAADHYRLMGLQDIKNLSVGELVKDNAHLYLWFTNAFAVEAHEVARTWGFDPKTIITWVKVKEDGSPSMKTGYYFRGATEHILFAVRGRLRLSGPPCPTVFFASRLPHSVKPEESYLLIEQHSPPARLELFGRRRRPSWYLWGDEMPLSNDAWEREIERVVGDFLLGT